MSEKKVILILGKRGSGKSHLAKTLLQQSKRFLVFDTLCEYKDGVIFENIKDLSDFWAEHIEKDFRLIYQPLNPVQEFDNICKLVWASGNMSFVVEELDTFCSSQNISDSFASIIQRGRHRDITLIGISQRPYGISRLITSQAKEIYTFIHTEPRDIEYLSMYMGKDVEKLRDLEQYHYLKWDHEGKISIQKA